LSFSGGKDSTVLKHIIDGMGLDIPAVFVDTGLEYPEIRKFVQAVKNGEYSQFNANVEIVKPELRFDEVVEKYGYPVPTKQVADVIEGARRNPNSTRMRRLNGQFGGRLDGRPSKFDCPQWKFLLDAPFKISAKCCDVMKKKPLHVYQKKTKRAPIIGVLATESEVRKREWLKTGCNAFSRGGSSRPLSFWTEDDILQYIHDYDVPYASVYGGIVKGDDGHWHTTGCDRTGCMFCMFGVHLEKGMNRFQKMKETHPKQYAYCMRPRSENGLGLKEVLDFIHVKSE
jgi:3'-phosphoadenosine 5'-phosphosulfate sulfotransferase (PAPS reductase)/FAD synthetase